MKLFKDCQRNPLANIAATKRVWAKGTIQETNAQNTVKEAYFRVNGEWRLRKRKAMPPPPPPYGAAERPPQPGALCNPPRHLPDISNARTITALQEHSSVSATTFLRTLPPVHTTTSYTPTDTHTENAVATPTYDEISVEAGGSFRICVTEPKVNLPREKEKEKERDTEADRASFASYYKSFYPQNTEEGDELSDTARRVALPTFGDWGLHYSHYDMPHLRHRASRGAPVAKFDVGSGSFKTRVPKQKKNMSKIICSTLDEFVLKQGFDTKGNKQKHQAATKGLKAIATKLDKRRTHILNKYRATPYAELWRAVSYDQLKEMYKKYAGSVCYSLTKSMFTSIHEMFGAAFVSIIEKNPLIVDDMFTAVDVSKDGKASFTEFVSAFSILLTTSDVQMKVCRVFDWLAISQKPYSALEYSWLKEKILPLLEGKGEAEWIDFLKALSDRTVHMSYTDPWSTDLFREVLFSDAVSTQNRFAKLPFPGEGDRAP